MGRITTFLRRALFRETPPAHFTGINRHGRLRKCGCKSLGIINCDACGGTGVRRVCMYADCIEYGCSYGTCVVPPEEAKAYLAHLARKDSRP